LKPNEIIDPYNSNVIESISFPLDGSMRDYIIGKYD